MDHNPPDLPCHHVDYFEIEMTLLRKLRAMQGQKL